MAELSGGAPERAAEEVAQGSLTPAALEGLRSAGLQALPVLEPHLTADARIEALERVEGGLKTILLDALAGQLSGPAAREIASFQQRLGFLRKYKSYGIKCSTPLGYSIFLLNPGQGFSFQRHITRKTEIFHILEVNPGGYVFVCPYEDWAHCYDPGSFASWLEGKADARYERYRLQPQPGDVIIMNRLNIVHTVIGCVLEEFATVSVDMVDRLHDQNAGHPIPSHFNRAYVEKGLAQIVFPGASSIVEGGGDDIQRKVIEPMPIDGGFETRLGQGVILASRLLVNRDQVTGWRRQDARATMLRVNQGAGAVLIADQTEIHRATPPSLAVGTGDTLLVAPGISYAFACQGDEALALSEHGISPQEALA